MSEGDQHASERDTEFDAGGPAQPRAHASSGRFARLCLKELRETLRDRRTIVTLVLMPLLVYPLLTMAFQRFLVTSLDTSPEFYIGLRSDAEVARLRPYLALGDLVLKNESAGRRKHAATAEARSKPTMALDVEPHINWKTGANLEQRVIDGSIHLAILLKESDRSDLSRKPMDVLRCELVHRADSPASKSALDHIQRRLRALNEFMLRQELRELGGDPTPSVHAHERSVGESRTALSLTTLIPLVLILMTITGAVYPAIDLTAGERERGTLEALMAAPVPRLGLLGGKYVAVLTVALLTAGANLVAMTVTLASTGLGKALFGPAGLSPLVLLQVFALLVLFAAFFSAILLAVTSFARSFKEAQAYLIPLMLLSLAPGMMTLMPGLELSGALAVTPLVNIVLLARDLLQGEVDPVLAVVAVVSTVFYAIAAIGLAARVFGTDALLYGSEASWSDLFRRPSHPRDAATLAGAMFCMAILLPCSFVAASLLHLVPKEAMQERILISAATTAFLFGGIPFIAASIQRVRMTAGFQLRAVRPFAFVGAAVVGVAAWPLAHEVFLLNRAFGFGTFSDHLVGLVEEMLTQWRRLPPWLIVFSLAVIPGVFEEFFFRGYLFRALTKNRSACNAILLTAVLFGAFHVVTSGMSPERFLPSTFLGLILGWVCWRTGSVLPGMLLHVCHNGLLLMIAYYRDELTARGWGVEERTHLPISWLAAATVGITVGVAIIMVAGSKPVANEVPSEDS